MSAMTLQWSGHTDKGRIRGNNEDTFLTVTFDALELRHLGKIGEGSLEQSDYVFAVSDGMGGAKSGEFASRIAVDKITRLLPKSFKVSASGLNAGRGDVLEDLVSSIHKEMNAMGRHYEECRGMGATLSLCWFSPDWMFFAHLGDSRIYHLPPDGPMRQVTEDHTYAGFLHKSGKLNEREARNHPSRSQLRKALGANIQFADPQLGALEVRPGDRILICSDGVVDGLWDRAIEDAVRSGISGDELVTLAVNQGSRDNVTALIITVA